MGDLREAGFSDSNLTVVASALRNKNANTMEQIHEPFTADEHTSKIERLIRRLVRIPDTIDIVRVRTIANDYPKTSSESQKECFNIQCLDIDPILATNDQFMNDLHDFLIHTLNLAYVTGGMPKVDLREKPYSQQHHFTQNPELNQARKKHIVFSNNPLNAIVIELDNNVRRHVAMVAGINVTSDHQLNQVEFPALTLLEKFQLNRPSVNNKLKPFIGKLKEAPQFRPLGSIRQDRLSEAPYRQRLENDYGLKAIEVQRQRGYKDDETPNYVNVWQVIEGN